MIGADGTDSSGMQRQGGDPTGASAEEAPLTPRGKRVPGAEINRKVPVGHTIFDVAFLFQKNE